MFRPGTKKTFLILLFLTLLAGIILFVIRYNKGGSVTENLLPEIHLVHTDVTGISEEHVTLLSRVSLENRMPVGVSIDSIAYVVLIEGKKIAYSVYPEQVDIDANGKSTVELPVKLAYKKLDGLFERLHNAGVDSTNMKMDVLLYSDLIPKDSAWVHVEQKIPVIVLPVVDVEQLKIHSLTGSSVTLHVNMLVINDNTMRFAFKDSKYKVIFEDHKAIEGVIPQTIDLPAKDSAHVTVPLELNVKEVGQALLDLIRKGTNMKYDVTVTTRPVTTIKNFKDSDIILHASGKLNTIKEAVN